MMFVISDITKLAPGLVVKLNKLYNFLKEEKNSCESISQRFSDKQLQRSMISLAQESNQYASEVRSQIYCLGGSVETVNSIAIENDTIGELILATSGNDGENIEELCSISESRLLNFYREIIEDPLMLAGLRKMFVYQMNGILRTVSQLRLLQQSLYKS